MKMSKILVNKIKQKELKVTVKRNLAKFTLMALFENTEQAKV